jgi:hypothetical protein
MATVGFWDQFLLTHGRDSATEAAFLGYLTTHDVDPGAPEELLRQAYTEFLAFMQASEAPLAEVVPTHPQVEAFAPTPPVVTRTPEEADAAAQAQQVGPGPAPEGAPASPETVASLPDVSTHTPEGAPEFTRGPMDRSAEQAADQHPEPPSSEHTPDDDDEAPPRGRGRRN